MDVLLIDENNTPVVVECKQNAPTLNDIRQLRNYMAQIKKDLRKVPRGILVHGGARKLRDDVRRAAEARPVIDLVQHNLEVAFSRST
jgi:RecB family endonuclease NucS